MKRSFFQAAVTSILLYGCTTWTLTKRLEKKLDGNYTRMLRAILNKSWQQHPTRHQLYGHLPPITKSIQVRRTRHAGHCWRSRDELIRDVLLWIPTHGAQKQDDQHERTFSSYVRIQVVVLKTYLGRWTIGRSGERGSGISVLPARYDDDDDDIWETGNLSYSSKRYAYAVLSDSEVNFLGKGEEAAFGHFSVVFCSYTVFNIVRCSVFHILGGFFSTCKFSAFNFFFQFSVKLFHRKLTKFDALVVINDFVGRFICDFRKVSRQILKTSSFHFFGLSS